MSSGASKKIQDFDKNQEAWRWVKTSQDFIEIQNLKAAQGRQEWPQQDSLFTFTQQ